MSPTEDHVRDLLRRAAPELGPVRFDDVAGLVRDRRRRVVRRAVGSVGVVAVAAAAVVVGTHASSGSPTPRSRTAADAPVPALIDATSAYRPVTVGVDFSVGPPRDPRSAIPPQSALARAWTAYGEGHATGATGARLTLAYVSRQATHTDVWIVVFKGGCVVQVSETSYPADRRCVHEPVTDVVAADSGRSLFGYAGALSDHGQRSSRDSTT